MEEYAERTWPGPWFWSVLLGMVACLAIAYGVAISPAAGWTVMALGMTGLLLAGSRLAARVRVGQQGVSAGRALLPWWAVGTVMALTREQVAIARGAAGDRSAWVVSPPGSGHGAVLVTVTDPADPHRTWLIASREPQGLARAIESAHGSLGE